jgi:predicted short-subunit dehydrogenase-like oxidoreductase (DUF2520 family)
MTHAEPLASVGCVGIIGAGAVGTALARALAACGADVCAVASRHADRARALAERLPDARALPAEVLVGEADLVLLAVPDGAIRPLAESLPWRAGQGVAHLCGAIGAEALAPAAARGARTASLHPLMTFTPAVATLPEAALRERLAGCSWALDAADAGLAATLEELVRALGGRAVRLGAEDRLPYHLAAVLASNYVVALMAGATRLWSAFGVAGDEALAALLPLLRGAVENLAADGLPQALSGPIARGDLDTVAAHLAWLREHARADAEMEALEAAYIALAEVTIPVAQARGTLSDAAAAQLRRLLSTARE